jgi:hypothetical protein
MAKCKHPIGFVWVTPGEAFVPRRFAGSSFNGQQRCSRCRQIVPYGPAYDDDEAVQIEIRAAEWQADVFTPFDEGHECPCSGCDARYLANVIAAHDDHPAPGKGERE